MAFIGSPSPASASLALAAAALQCYAIGLTAYASMKVLAPAFYAIDKRRTPMFVSFFAIGLNLLLNWLFTIQLGYGVRGLAFSTGCVALTNFGILYFLMKRETRLLDTKLLVNTLLKIALPLILLAGVCMAGKHWLLADWATMPILKKIVALFGTMTAATAVFAGCAALMRIEEMNDLVALVKRKLRR
jgi:putative peptidoglycan lipid II flippase